MRYLSLGTFPVSIVWHTSPDWQKVFYTRWKSRQVKLHQQSFFSSMYPVNAAECTITKAWCWKGIGSISCSITRLPGDVGYTTGMWVLSIDSETYQWILSVVHWSDQWDCGMPVMCGSHHSFTYTYMYVLFQWLHMGAFLLNFLHFYLCCLFCTLLYEYLSYLSVFVSCLILICIPSILMWITV